MDEAQTERRIRSLAPAVGDAPGPGKFRAIRKPFGSAPDLWPAARRLKFKSIFIFRAKDAAMFGPVTRAEAKNQSNQHIDDVSLAHDGHTSGPELPNYGANNAINGCFSACVWRFGHSFPGAMRPWLTNNFQ